ncbi:MULTISPECIES: AraC family transcriptional regulator [Burkholderia]|uniref:AraC family transcriptional regulator n=1 Tax=Burkholderia TaxID=32008 RepID=UPI00084148A1|nr:MULTISPECIES: GyrI-like domain-containing protein [unclassified Burkholderia]AOK30789.1 hypothetical protein AQ611_01860 [Burkholderia sp. Bp7605]
MTEYEYRVEIRQARAIDVLAVDHVGPYPEINRAFDTLSAWIGERGLFGPETQCIGIFHDDPHTTPAEQLHAQACFALGPATASINVTPPVTHATVAGGEHAVLVHRGPYADLQQAYDWLYGTWLPNSGRESADAPPFELYLNSPADTQPADLVTEIHVPLR